MSEHFVNPKMTADAGRTPKLDRLLIAVSAFVPAALALFYAENTADASHEDGAIRVLGFASPGIGRALDVLTGAPCLLLPFGTRGFRASLSGVLLTAAAGALIFSVARLLLSASTTTRRFSLPVAVWSSVVPTLMIGWQVETIHPGGGVLGAVLAWGPFSVLALLQSKPRVMPLLVLTLVLAVTYDAWVGVSACTGAIAFMAFSDVPLREHALRMKRDAAAVCIAAVIGFAPTVAIFVCAQFARRSLRGSSVLGQWLGVDDVADPLSPLAVLLRQLGWGTPLLALGGCVLAMAVRGARPFVAALVALMFTGLLAQRLGAIASPTHTEGVALAALAAMGPLAGVALQEIMVRVAKARVPFARESAALVGLLALAIPAQFAEDDGFQLVHAKDRATREWDEVAWGSSPTGTLMLVHAPDVFRHIVATRVRGTFRGDITVIPSFDLAGPLAVAELAREPRLIPFWRDVATGQDPDEWSLSSLAIARPLVLVATPPWGRLLARHLVPSALTARFEPEPRGMSDRKHALEKWAGSRRQLAARLSGDADRPLRKLAEIVLNARVEALRVSGDRDLIPLATEDVHLFTVD